MKILKYLIVTLIIFGVLFATAYFIKTNSKSITEYKTETPFISSVEQKTVVTGKVIPEDEVEIKPQLNGIIENILVEEGDEVVNGQLIAVIKVVPDERSVYAARAQVTAAKLTVQNGERQIKRARELYDKPVSYTHLTLPTTPYV